MVGNYGDSWRFLKKKFGGFSWRFLNLKNQGIYDRISFFEIIFHKMAKIATK
jgi:hypothetical protein